MPDLDHARMLADLAVRLQRAHDEEPTARAVVARALELIPDADRASLTVRAARGTFVTLAATDGRARDVDGLQYVLREGPGIDAATSGEWYRSGSVGADPRWPEWGPRAAASHGVGSVLSIQLAGDQVPLGSLNLYAARAGRFADRDEVEFALLYGAHVGVALLAAREIDGLKAALSTRHSIGLAQGMLMERFGLSVDASFQVMRRFSAELGLRLAVVAEEVVTSGRTPPTPPDP